MLGGDWTKSDTGFRGYPASWITASASRGVGKLGTRAPRAPLEVHVDLSGGIVAPWPTGKVRTVLQWILKQDGHLTRLDCAFDDRNSCVPLSTIRQAIEVGQCVTRADRMQRISSSSIHKATPSGETLYLGSPQSQTLLRIYDKRLESQSKAARGLAGVRHPVGVGVEKGSRPGLWTGPVLPGGNRLARIHGGVLRGYVDFRATTRDEEDEFRYRAPLLDWWLLLTDGFKKGRLVVGEGRADVTQGETLGESVRGARCWPSSVRQIPVGQPGWRNKSSRARTRWKAPHRRLAKQEEPLRSQQDAGGHAGAPFQGGEGVS